MCKDSAPIAWDSPAPAPHPVRGTPLRRHWPLRPPLAGPAPQPYVADRTPYAERTAGVACLTAAMGLGETIGPGFGSMLAVLGLAAPLYFAAALSVASAALPWQLLPEETPPHAAPRASV